MKRIKNVPFVHNKDCLSLVFHGFTATLHSSHQQFRGYLQNLRLAFDLSIHNTIEQTI